MAMPTLVNMNLYPIQGSTRPGRYAELKRAYRRLRVADLLARSTWHGANVKTGAEGR